MKNKNVAVDSTNSGVTVGYKRLHLRNGILRAWKQKGSSMFNHSRDVSHRKQPIEINFNTTREKEQKSFSRRMKFGNTNLRRLGLSRAKAKQELTSAWDNSAGGRKESAGGIVDV